MNNQSIIYENLADLLFQAVKSLEFGSALELDNDETYELRDQVLSVFYENYELIDYSGELVVSDRRTGEIVRDQFLNTLSLKEVLKKIAKKIQPLMDLEKEVIKLPTKSEFSKYMRKSGIPKHSQIRSRLLMEWIHAHKDEQIMQTSEYWY